MHASLIVPALASLRIVQAPVRAGRWRVLRDRIRGYDVSPSSTKRGVTLEVVLDARDFSRTATKVTQEACQGFRSESGMTSDAKLYCRPGPKVSRCCPIHMWIPSNHHSSALSLSYPQSSSRLDTWSSDSQHCTMV